MILCSCLMSFIDRGNQLCGLQWIETGGIAVQELAHNREGPAIDTVSVMVVLWWQKYPAGVHEELAQCRNRALGQGDRKRW